MIQIVLITLFVAGLAYVFVLSKGDRPARKIGLALIVAVAIVFIAAPDLTNRIANFMGVGRGADLVLYFFIPVMLFSAANLYIRNKQLERRIFTLTSELAILAHDVELVRRWGGSGRAPRSVPSADSGNAAQPPAPPYPPERKK